MKKIIPIFGIALIVVVILVYMFNGNKTEKVDEPKVILNHQYDLRLSNNSWYYKTNRKIEVYNLDENSKMIITGNFIHPNTNLLLNDTISIDNIVYAKCAWKENDREKEGYIIKEELDRLDRFYNTSSKTYYVLLSDINELTKDNYVTNRYASTYELKNNEYVMMNDKLTKNTNLYLIYKNDTYAFVSIIEDTNESEESVVIDNTTQVKEETKTTTEEKTTKTETAKTEDKKTTEEKTTQTQTAKTEQIKVEEPKTNTNTSTNNTTSNNNNNTNNTTVTNVTEDNESLDGDGDIYVTIPRKDAIVVPNNEDADEDDDGEDED